MVAEQDLIFVIFRLLPAVVTSATAAFLAWHYWKTRDLYPRVVWNYTGIILTLVAIYRWVVVWITLPGQSESYSDLQEWLGPMSQTGFLVLSIVILVLTVTHVAARKRHYTEWHEDE